MASMNETEAAEWLRGDPERRVIGEGAEDGEWRYAPVTLGTTTFGYSAFFRVGTRGVFYSGLKPGAYYPLQPGTELSAALAWAYLSANEKRRCSDRDGDTCRARDGALEYLEPGADKWERFSYDGPTSLDCSPYTILPDAEQPDNAKRAEAYLRGGEPVVADKERTWLYYADGTFAWRSVAERGGCQYLPSGHYTLPDGSPIPDAPAEPGEYMAKAQRDADAAVEYLRVEAERATPPETTAERIKALEAERDRLRKDRECLSFAANERIAELEAERGGRVAAHNEIFDALQKSTADLDAAETTIRDLRAELAPYQLPADGEPLTLVQRAVALGAGRIVGRDKGRMRYRLRVDRFVSCDEDDDEYMVDADIIFDPAATITLLPLPTPGPRQLTFAEAVEIGEQSTAEPQTVVAWCEELEVGINALGHVFRWGLRNPNSRQMIEPLTVAMLAATWTEVPHG